MNLRSRLMLGSLVVILALSGVYLVLSLTATDTVFTNYEDHVQKKSTEQIQGLFASFYVKNGGKWDGVAKILPNTWP